MSCNSSPTALGQRGAIPNRPLHVEHSKAPIPWMLSPVHDYFLLKLKYITNIMIPNIVDFGQESNNILVWEIYVSIKMILISKQIQHQPVYSKNMARLFRVIKDVFGGYSQIFWLSTCPRHQTIIIYSWPIAGHSLGHACVWLKNLFTNTFYLQFKCEGN